MVKEVVVNKNFIKREIVDPVWLMKEYSPKILKIEDAIQNHIELAQVDMFNNMDGFLTARLLLDMTSKKKVLLN